MAVGIVVCICYRKDGELCLNRVKREKMLLRTKPFCFRKDGRDCRLDVFDTRNMASGGFVKVCRFMNDQVGIVFLILGSIAGMFSSPRRIVDENKSHSHSVRWSRLS